MNAHVPVLRLALASTLALGALIAVAATGETPTASAPDAARAPFALLDSDRDGLVSAPELGTWLRAQGDRTPIDTATLGARALARFDRNRDGHFTVADQPAAKAGEDGVRTLLQLAPRDATRVAVEDEQD